MILDIIFLIVLIYFVSKGYSRGAIMSLLVSIASILGFMVASKFSGTLAKMLFTNDVEGVFFRLMPIIAYFLVFFAVVFLVKLIAKFTKNVVRKVSLSGIDKLLGAVIYLVLVLMITSIFYWFVNQIHILSPETMYTSKSYQILEPLAATIFERIGTIFPFIKSSFHDLLQYFEYTNTKLDNYVGFN